METQGSVESCAGSEGKYLVAVKYGDWFMSFYRRLFSLSRFETVEGWLVRIGHIGLLAVAGLGLLAGLVIAIKTNTLSNLLTGLAWVPLVLVFQYVAAKFIPADGLLLKSSPSELSSRAFLDCIGLIGFLAGLVVWIYAIFSGIREEEWGIFGWGTGIFVAAGLFLVMTLNPETLNITIKTYSSAGEEAMGIWTFFVKVSLRLVPFVYGIGVILAAVWMVVNLVQVFKGNISEFMEMGPTLVMTGGSALLPLGAYLLFVLSYLGIDVLRAILSVPRKLDDLIRK